MATGLIRVIGIAITVLAVLATVSSAAPLRVITEDYAPFGYVDDGKLTGVGPEIVYEMAKVLGVADLKVEVLPWKRAYQLALNDQDVALFSMSRIAQREKLFKWVGPLYTMGSFLFGRHDYAKEIKSIEDAKKAKSILLQAGGASETRLLAQGFNNLVPIQNIDQQIKMLTIGRVELASATDATVAYQMRKQGIPTGTVKPVFWMNDADLYLAFSLKTDDKVINKWRAALDAIRKNGRWQKITEKFMPALDKW